MTAEAQAKTDIEAGTAPAAGVCYVLGKEESWIQGKEIVDLEAVQLPQKPAGQIGGEFIKSFVFGGLDGICSTFALVAGLGGAKVRIETLIAVSLAKVLADAFSMGFGEYTSANAELESSQQTKEKQMKSVEANRDAEAKDLLEYYKEAGCDTAHALTIVSILARYKDLFLEHTLAFRQGVFVEEEEDKWQSLKQGFVCFAAFVAFGLVPLLGFIIFYAIDGGKTNSYEAILGLAYGLTAFTLFTMGVTKAKLTGSDKVLKSGVIMVINGTFAGGAAYLVGELLSLAFGDV
jgi:VIT1/CCC1 family predicted Fe2+/Mn2+ transporter